MRKTTNVFFIENGKILLGFKKRGFGVNKYNGFGGKVEPNETIEDAAIRECIEEVGLTPSELIYRGTIKFNYTKVSESTETTIFQVNKWKGEITESEEMRPQWFDLNQPLPISMWPDVKYWWSQFQDNIVPNTINNDHSSLKPLDFSFYFDSEYNVIEHKDHNINNKE